MKRTSSRMHLTILLAAAALPLGACLAPSLDADDERVAEAEEELTTWVADTPISGQTSRSAPTLTTYNNDAVMVHRGGTNDNLYMSTYFGTSWLPQVQIPGQQSKASVALAQHGTRLHMAYLCGTQSYICYSSYQSGGAWTPPVALSFTSKLPPALVSDPITNRLMLVFVSADNLLRYGFFDGNWQTPNIITTGGWWVAGKAPTLAVHQGRVHMVFEALDGLIRHSSFDGSWWAPTALVSFASERNNPSLASYAGTLYLFHRGLYDNKIWWSASSDGNSWSADVSIPGALTDDSPSVTTGGVVLVLGHKSQSDTKLFYSTLTF